MLDTRFLILMASIWIGEYIPSTQMHVHHTDIHTPHTLTNLKKIHYEINESYY